MRAILLTLLVVVLAISVGAVYYFFLSPSALEATEDETVSFTAIETGRAGNSGYAVFNRRGEVNLSLLSLKAEPYRRITIVNDSGGMEMGSLPELVGMIRTLEDYGYTVEVSDRQYLSNGLYLIPTGAIPNYVYDNLWYNASNATILFIGHKDLVIRRGIKKENWFDSLSAGQKERITVYDTTVDQMVESGDKSLINDILFNSWSLDSASNRVYGGHGLGTTTVYMSEQSSHLRLIYENSAGKGIVDSKEIQDPGKVITPDPVSVYPWQKSTVSFGLNRTNGTAELMVFKDTELVRKEELRRVTDDNFFIKRLEFDDPGNYVIEVSDNHGRIASGLLHIYDLNIELVEDAGVTYVFNVTVDSEPMESGEVTVSLNNGTSSKDLYINEGSLKINAKLDEGMNTFNMKMLGTTIPVQVEHHGGSVFQFYLTYGIPGLILVGAVFLIARMSRRPIYRIRFSDVGSQIRKEIMLSPDDALSALKSIREEMSLQKSPITADEFAIAIKRYVTNGAEVTSGNVEEILNRLCNKGILESHQGYYQPKGEGEIKRNALMRIIREKLIENGITFKAMKNKFSTKDCEIGFFGGNFKKKALIIVDDENELRSIMDSLDEKEKSRLKIRQSNDMLVFVPISKLVDYL